MPSYTSIGAIIGNKTTQGNKFIQFFKNYFKVKTYAQDLRNIFALPLPTSIQMKLKLNPFIYLNIRVRDHAKLSKETSLDKILRYLSSLKISQI